MDIDQSPAPFGIEVGFRAVLVLIRQVQLQCSKWWWRSCSCLSEALALPRTQFLVLVCHYIFVFVPRISRKRDEVPIYYQLRNKIQFIALRKFHDRAHIWKSGLSEFMGQGNLL